MRQQRARQCLGIALRDGYFKTIFPGIAAACQECRHQPAAAAQVKMRTRHENQAFHPRCQPRQGACRLWPLQRKKCLFGQCNNAAPCTNTRVQMRQIVGLARAIDNGEYAVLAFDEHQVIDDAALVIEQQSVALSADGQVQHVHGNQALQRGLRLWAGEQQLAHVRHVKKAGPAAGVQVFCHQSLAVLHRHGIGRECNHARAKFKVQRVQRGGTQRRGGCVRQNESPERA